jgi:hypothetical protein
MILVINVEYLERAVQKYYHDRVTKKQLKLVVRISLGELQKIFITLLTDSKGDAGMCWIPTKRSGPN